MFFYTGKGYLVAAITFGSSLTGNLLCNSITGGRAYWDNHKWPLAVCLFSSATVCWFVGQAITQRTRRVLLDPQTFEEVVLDESHTFFFIPITWWAPLLIVFGVLAIGSEFA